MPQTSSVPQFGNWGDGNFPITQCFENVRKKKSDPRSIVQEDTKHVQQGNPQKLKNSAPYNDNENPGSDTSWRQMDKKSIDENASHPYQQFQPRQEKDRSEYVDGIPPRTPVRTRFEPTPQTHEPQATIPKWGDWEANPNMTLIFDNVRKKKPEGRNTPSAPQTPSHNNHTEKSKAKDSKSLISQWFKKIKAMFGK